MNPNTRCSVCKPIKDLEDTLRFLFKTFVIDEIIILKITIAAGSVRRATSDWETPRTTTRQHCKHLSSKQENQCSYSLSRTTSTVVEMSSRHDEVLALCLLMLSIWKPQSCPLVCFTDVMLYIPLLRWPKIWGGVAEFHHSGHYLSSW